MEDASKDQRFARVALPHQDAAYNLARWLTRNNDDAEDVVQEAYLRAFKFFDGFRGGDGKAWLMAIVRNTCFTWLQRNRPAEVTYSFDEEADSVEEGSAEPAPQAWGSNPETNLLARCDAQILNRAVEELPLEFREVLVLRELEELSYKEIAAVAAIPIGTVMSRLARGRRLLAQSVGKFFRES